MLRNSSGAFSIVHRREIRLEEPLCHCRIDGKARRILRGKWMFYIPRTGEKFFYAKDGLIDFGGSYKPNDLEHQRKGRYSRDEWRRALQTPVHRRVAQLVVVTQRLWKAGLGPKLLGVTFADRLIWRSEDRGFTAGVVVEDVYTLPRKANCTEQDVINAGVQPDKSLSCVRQQKRGYVIDLSSVVSARPIDAEDEVEQIEQWILHSRDVARSLVPQEANHALPRLSVMQTALLRPFKPALLRSLLP